MKKYVLGIDFGTESGRALLVDVADGTEVATHVTPYPHGVIDDTLPGTEIRLGVQWALQDPQDYLDVLRDSVAAVVSASGVDPVDIVGIGIAFTSCTILPVDADGTPLCFLPHLRSNPHSWVKLWKHHAAQKEADRLNETAMETHEVFLKRYGGRISSEWMIPKVWQVLSEAPEVYEQTDQFLEGADWIVAALTGVILRNSCTAGYKALWHKEEGYPEPGFFKRLDPGLEDVAQTKLRGQVVPLGTKAGPLSARMADFMGLVPGIAVAVGSIDAHASMLGAGVVVPGKMVMAMGTSTCHMLLGTEEKYAEGISGVVEDGIVPGFFGYEAGQSAVGDIFAWFVEHGVPAYVQHEAETAGESVHAWLEKRASAHKPGASGLLALDWWNGNRSVLMDADLSGVIVGCSLHTKPEEIYRALLESTAFGTRRIIDAFEEGGVEVRELCACGGLPLRNRLLMQIYADVTGREIKIAASTQTAALGAAMFGAVAAGSAVGGYDSIVEATEKMARLREEIFRPIKENVVAYEQLYRDYCTLYDYFGRGGNDVMKRLSGLRARSADQENRHG